MLDNLRELSETAKMRPFKSLCYGVIGSILASNGALAVEASENVESIQRIDDFEPQGVVPSEPEIKLFSGPSYEKCKL